MDDFHAFCVQPWCRAGSNNSRSIHNMILDSIFERENYGKGWLGYNVMPRAPQAIFVELLVAASLAAAVVLIPMMRTVVQKLWHQRQITWQTPMLAGSCSTMSFPYHILLTCPLKPITHHCIFSAGLRGRCSGTVLGVHGMHPHTMAAMVLVFSLVTFPWRLLP